MVIEHNKNFDGIDNKMAQVKTNEHNEAKKALDTDDKITGLQNQVETLTFTV